MLSKARLKYFASLQRKKNRDSERRFLVEGVRTCEELLRSPYEIDCLLYCPALLGSDRGRQLLAAYGAASTPVEKLDKAAFDKIAATTHSQGVVAVAKTLSFRFDSISRTTARLLLLLDEIREPGNLGTIIRTAVWFGVQAVLVSKKSAEFTNPKVIRATMGAGFHIPILTEIEPLATLKRLRKFGYEIVIADPDSEVELAGYNFSEPSVLVLGNETSGVSKELVQLATATLSIPRSGCGDSLNVAVAAGIFLAAMSKSIS